MLTLKDLQEQLAQQNIVKAIAKTLVDERGDTSLLIFTHKEKRSFTSLDESNITTEAKKALNALFNESVIDASCDVNASLVGIVLDVNSGEMRENYSSFPADRSWINQAVDVNLFDRAFEMQALGEIGIVRIEAEYEGRGDGGEVTEVSFYVSFYNEKDENITRFMPSMIRQQGEDFVLGALDALESGWEIDDGGQGSLHYDLTTGALKLNHESHYVDEKYMESTFNVDTAPDVESFKGLLSALREALPNKCVTIKYKGENDSGDFIGSSVKDSAMNNALIDLAYEVLDRDYAGWEIDAGSEGEIELDVSSGEAKVMHTQYQEGSEFKEKAITLYSRVAHEQEDVEKEREFTRPTP